MKTLLLLVVLAAAFFLIKRLVSGPSVTPQEAMRRIVEGTAVLIDVREPGEWASGVAGPANLLPLSDLTATRSRWRAFLDAHRDQELIVYCRSGSRSGIAAGILRREGFRAVNAGGFGGWQRAGLPTRQP